MGQIPSQSEQFVTCLDCGGITYEILSRTPQQVSAEQFAPGRTIELAGQRYQVVRLFRFGPRETVIYVRPSG